MGFRPLSLPLLVLLAGVSLSTIGSSLPEPQNNVERGSTCPPGNLLSTYWAPWKNAKQTSAQIPWSAVTDFAFYSFAITASDPSILTFADGHISEFVQAAHTAGKRALLSVGGQTGTYYFSPLVGTASSRATFSQTILRTVQQYGFDGADIDWEYPNYNDGNLYNSADSDNLLSFVAVLRQTMGSLLITMAAPPFGWFGADGNHLANTAPYATYVDYIASPPLPVLDTIMAYNEYGPWLSITGPQSPMNDCDPGGAGWTSVPEVVGYWTGSGFPACQLLLVSPDPPSDQYLAPEQQFCTQGIATYSHNFTTSSSTLATTYYNGQSTTAFQPTESNQPADNQPMLSDLIPNYLSSDQTTGAGGYTRCKFLSVVPYAPNSVPNLSHLEDWDACTQAPYLFNAQTRSFIAYEDAQSTGIKAQWAATHGLAGVTLYDSVGMTPRVITAAQQGLSGSFATSEPISAPSNGSGGPAVSSKGLCAGTTGQTCAGSSFGSCCSAYGYCGSSADYCGSGCQAAFGTCPGSSSTASSVVSTSSQSASSAQSSSKTSANSSAPSKASSLIRGTSSTSTSSAIRPSSTLVPSTSGACGGSTGFTCLGGSNSAATCCSAYGYCGSDSGYCGSGCQSAFGTW
ncbi:chitinase, partial [Phenoliferia sp. Uapishka_3]